MARKFVWFAIALIIVSIVLVDAKSVKGVAKKKSKGKKNTGKKPSTAQVAAPNVAAPNVAAPSKAAPSKAAPIKPTPVAPAPVDLFNNPLVKDMIGKVGRGEKVSTSEMIPLMLVGVQSGISSTNPALSSLAATVNETALALSKSKDGKLSTGQMMVYSNKMLTSLGNATDTPKENMVKIKACMASGMTKVNTTDLPAVFGLIQNCSQFFGNGTEDGNAGVFKLATVFLPNGIREAVQSPGVLDLMGAVMGQAGGIAAGKDPVAAAPALVDALGSMAKDAGFNLDFSQLLGQMNFGR